MFGNEFNLQ